MVLAAAIGYLLSLTYTTEATRSTVRKLMALTLSQQSMYIADHTNFEINNHYACHYSLIQMKCQGGNKYALPITVKFDQSTRRFGRISFARLFKLTKHIALLFYLLSPYLLSCMRGLRIIRKNLIKTFAV